MIVGVTVIGFLLAIFAAVLLVDGQYVPILVCFLVFGGVAAFFTLKNNMWILIAIFLASPITLNFLPIPFSLSELAVISSTAYIFFVTLLFEKGKISLGPRHLCFPLILIVLLIVYHWFGSGGGFRVLGSANFGARRNFSMCLALVAFVVILSAPRKSAYLIKNLPLLFLGGTILGVAPFLLTSFFPFMSPYVNLISGNVNVEAYSQAMTQSNFTEGGMGRIGQLSTLGVALQLCLLSYFPLTTWWRPNRWWVSVLALLALYFVIRSGFRSGLFYYVIISMAGAFFWLRWKSLLLWPPGLTVLLLIGFMHGKAYQLPFSMQRTLSFLPLEFDTGVKESAKGSNDFRQQVQDLYLLQFAGKSPWIGNGFKFDALEVTQWVAFGADSAGEGDPIRRFITKKDFHIGWISVYDSIGVIGFGFFLWFCWSLMYEGWKLIPKSRDYVNPLKPWLFCYLMKEIVAFFAVFGAIQNIFLILSTLGALIWAIRVLDMHDEKDREDKKVPVVNSPESAPA